MAHDEHAWYSPNAPQAAPRQPKPGELLWEFVREHDHKHFRCELRFHGESYGWEAQLLLELLIGRRFDTRALAVQWAELEQKDVAKGGRE